MGGEDISFKAEADLLEKMGNVVLRYTRDNDEIRNYGLLKKMLLLFNTIWSFSTLRDLELILRKEKPDLVHFQNTFPLISPSAFYACKHQNIPVIMSARNYRLMCVNGLFLRDNQICEDCINKVFAWPGVYHACYRNSFLQSTVVALMVAYHRLRKTWLNYVHIFICLSEFSRRKYIQGKIPEQKIMVKPNFVEDPGENDEKREYAIFIGRLSVEKGIQTILKSIANNPTIPLLIIGSGPLEEEVKRASEKLENINYLGELGHDQILDVIKKARFLIYPSLCYETFGRVIVEAYACGVPVITSRIGALQELVYDGVTGLFINPGDVEDLSNKMRWLWEHPEESSQMGMNARNEYLKRFTPEINYQSLMSIYSSVLETKE
jgi:glycosyltransferase involved in cell wall biosynthesis